MCPDADDVVARASTGGRAPRTEEERRVSGALLVLDDWFVQVLEGDETEVRSLYATIERDPRHERVTLVEAGPVPERVFARGAMARVSPDGSPDIPLIAHTDGISRAAGHPATPEQEQVLAAMRETLRPSAQTV